MDKLEVNEVRITTGDTTSTKAICTEWHCGEKPVRVKQVQLTRTHKHVLEEWSALSCGGILYTTVAVAAKRSSSA